MAITYSLGINPKWYIADLVGRPLGAGSMYTYRSLDKTQLKFIFTDPAGNFPWPDPVLFDENGSQGPFFWQSDSLNPQETYYIEVYDAQGVLQWTFDGFLPPGGGGGGGDITEALSLENLIVNNVLWRNFGTSATPVPQNLVVAPGAHAALAQTISLAGPDIQFIKNNNAASDTLSFVPFTLGTTPFTGDVTPAGYLNYACGNTPAGEITKCVQFPITANVQNLSNQSVVVTIWAQLDTPGLANQLTVQWRQFFGDGVGASADVITVANVCTLTTSWQKFQFTASIPSVATKTLGGCGNSALFLQVQYPLGTVCNIDFIKPSVYLGNIPPNQDYYTNDMIDAVINAKRTGYVELGYDINQVNGFVIMNDGSIGNTSSGATTRANIDTFPLYNLLYNNVVNTWAPVSGGRTGSAINDFIANKTLTLTKQLGRVLGNSGNGVAGAGLTARVLGQFLGEENHVLTAGELAAHTHPSPSGQFLITASPGTVSATGGGGATGANNTGANTGGQGHNTMQPTSFINTFIKL